MTIFIQGTVFAKDLERMLEFYQSLGFEPESIKPNDFGVLRSDESELTVVQIPEHISAEITISKPPVVRSDTAIKLVFVVPRIDEALKNVEKNGGSQGDFQAWQYADFIAQECVDPEGNVLQLRQINDITQTSE